MKKTAAPTRPESPPGASELRRRAEKRLQKQTPETDLRSPATDTLRLIHELQVHQIELEMQKDELLQARSELEAGLEKYRDLYDFAPVGYLTLDREGIIQEVNLAAASLLGISRSRLFQRRFGFFVAAADRPIFMAFLTKVFTGQGLDREFCEVKLLKDGHSPVAVRIGAAAASGQECRAVLEDLTEIKRAEADRLTLNKLESTGILAGGIAHDFNNLLTVILLDLELAMEIPVPGAGMVQLLKEAKKAGWAARSLTQQLITFASGGAPVREPARLAGLIQESTRLVLSGSKVRCDFSLADDLRPVEADTGQIGQVIRNLVQNVREAMPDGGSVFVRAENVVLGRREKIPLPPGNYVRVSIADQGCGIAQEVLPKIFDPYFSTKAKGNQKGMGLGLTICFSIIKRHEGVITVESEVGRGTTFHFFLPAPQDQPKPVLEDKTSGPTPRRRTGRILIMDDKASVRKAVGATLKLLGHAVETAADGKETIDAFKKAKDRGDPFDAVMLDLTIHTGLGGQETLRELIKFDPSVQAILMTGYSSDPALLDPESHGFKGGLAKPFSRDLLQKMLARIIPNRPDREEKK